MMWKSLREEWPYNDDEVWLRWTTDGVTYHEKTVHEKQIPEVECIGIPEWRSLDPPDWLDARQKEEFLGMHGPWTSRIERINGNESQM